MGGSGGLEDDAVDGVGDVFAFVDGGFNDFEDFFPLDDLDGIFFFVEELGDEGAAEAVAVVFVAISCDAMLQRFLRPFERANGNLGLRSCRNQNLDEIQGSGTDAIDAIEHEAAGGGVDEVNDVIEAAAELVNVFAVERSDEGLIQLGEKGVGDLVAFVLDGFNYLHLFRDTGVVREQFKQGIRAHMNIGRLFGEEVEEALFARQEALQKSWHL